MGRQLTPEGVDRKSLTGFLSGKPAENWRDYVHLELDFGQPDKATKKQIATGTDLQDSNLSILREARFKLVHFNGDLPPMLFDLQNDPHEMEDLAGDPSHANTLLRLTQKLLSHKMQHANSTFNTVRIRSDGAWGFEN